MPLPLRIVAGILLLLISVRAGPSDKTELPDIFAISDPEKAVESVERAIAAAKDQARLRGLSYVAGRALERNGDFAGAANRYFTATADRSPVGTYALWRLSKVMRLSGNLPLERIFLLEAATSREATAAGSAAASRLIESHFESGDNEDVVRLGESGAFPGEQKKPLNTEQDRAIIILTARAKMASGDAKGARIAFSEALNSTADAQRPDDIALDAVEGLDRLDTAHDPLTEDIDAETHFLRGEIYQYNRRFRAARAHFKAIFEKHSESDLVPAAVYQIGVGYSRDRDYHNAIEWFERLQGEFPDSAYASDALYATATAYANVGKPKESSSRYEKYIDEHPESGKRPDAFLNLIDLYRDEGEPGEAAKWIERTLQAYPEDKIASQAVFARARLHISQNDWVQALADLDSLKNLRSPGPTFDRETEFVRGFVLEKLQKYYAAADAYAQIPDGPGIYYGWRATDRLKALADPNGNGNLIPRQYESYLNAARQEITKSDVREVRFAAASALRMTADKHERDELAAILQKTFEMSPEYEVSKPPKMTKGQLGALLRKVSGSAPGHMLAAEALLDLKVWDEGAAELEIAARQTAGAGGLDALQSDEGSTIAELYRRGGLVSRSLAESEARWRNVPDDYPLEVVPEEELRNLYPAPFRDEVLRYSGREGVDPRLVLSIMRQESRFDPDVKSSAAARGLMQFVPETAARVAAELKIGGFVRDDLYDPATSIRLGTRYLANLFREFPNQPAAVAAAYNAGEDRMLRWYQRSHSDHPDRYVPEIRIPQTKDYVRKVMANYRAYLLIYDKKLLRRSR